jgi:hypothetical protein
MTAIPGVRRLPESVDAVEVYGSKFLLEWLDLDVLAAAAANHLTARPTGRPVQQRAA